jgi:hypothetical protein
MYELTQLTCVLSVLIKPIERPALRIRAVRLLVLRRKRIVHLSLLLDFILMMKLSKLVVLLPTHLLILY